MRLTRFVLTALLVVSGVCGCAMPPPLRVLSFNIRYGTADDGTNRWSYRRDLVIQTIRANAPDVIGMQEVLAFQADELRQALPEYEYVGVGRDDGVRGGEAVPIMFKRERFVPVDLGHIWLSPQPDQPGLCGWDAACPRMITWVRLGFRKYPLNSFYVFNTHFDHHGERARLESAKLLRRATDALGGKPLIVMGDFNCGPGSPPYAVPDCRRRQPGGADRRLRGARIPGAGCGHVQRIRRPLRWTTYRLGAVQSAVRGPASDH